ncbi:hypothetical protein [Lutibacter citreus]|uniref:hypothetical protein n=1 Tax=Lutibacter citreus TaxID=2138210 RepID=UPI000DBE17DF|nr:hypothetical protein [Lutibacter citreus]
MENSNTKAVFNLMQNIVDKLDEVSAKIDIKNDTVQKPESDFLTNLPIEFNKLLLQQNNISKRIDTYNQELTNSLKSSIGTNETNNYECIIFGKDSPLNTKFVIIVIAFICISWAAIKYVPPFLLNRSELKQEKENYQTFYNYIYLKKFESHKELPQDLENLFEKIKSKEAILMNEYNELNEVYKKEMRKQKLESELKKLQ